MPWGWSNSHFLTIGENFFLTRAINPSSPQSSGALTSLQGEQHSIGRHGAGTRQTGTRQAGNRHTAGTHWMNDHAQRANCLECENHKSSKLARPSMESSQAMFLFTRSCEWTTAISKGKMNKSEYCAEFIDEVKLRSWPSCPTSWQIEGGKWKKW